MSIMGTPIPGAEVVCLYTWQGREVRRTATTDQEGKFSFPDVPFDVTVKVSVQGQTKDVTCTAQNPQVSVSFGWQGVLGEHTVTPQ